MTVSSNTESYPKFIIIFRNNARIRFAARKFITETAGTVTRQPVIVIFVFFGRVAATRQFQFVA